MKRLRTLTLIIGLVSLLVIYTNVSAEPIISADQLLTVGDVCVSNDDFKNVLPTKETPISETDKNVYGQADYWGNAGMSFRMNNSYMNYGSPSDVTISVKTAKDIKKGDICVISFKSATYWSPDGKLSYMFGIKNDTKTYKTAVINAEMGFDNQSTFTWKQTAFYAFEADMDYPAGSDFQVYLGFNNSQSGFISELELRNIGNEYSYKMVKYALGMEGLTKKQTATFSFASGYDNREKKMSINDSLKVTFKAPVADFKINDFLVEGGAKVESFELSEDKCVLTIHFSGLEPNKSYNVIIDNIITEEIDYRKYNYEFNTLGNFVVDNSISGKLPNRVSLKKGENNLALKVNNATGNAMDACVVAVVYKGTKTNYTDIDSVFVSKKSNIKAFDDMSINVTIADSDKKFVKLYVWNNIKDKAPMTDEFTFNCN